ncbi:MAG: DUF4231 domain-containing protein [Cyclobacteriaceae bacterium]
MRVNHEEYIQSRLNEQIEWYERKSAFNQRLYRRLQLCIIISSSTIPFLSAYTQDYVFVAVFIGIVGVLVAALTAVNGFYKYQENWISYRSTCEALKHQKFLFLTGTDPYHEQHAFHLLVQNVEKLISRENETWNKQMEKPRAPSSLPSTHSQV